MKRKPLGCLSFTGLFAALLTLAAVAFGYVSTGGAMFSPGALNAQTAAVPLGGVYSHSDTGGNCSTCHAPPFSSTNMAKRCLECHEDIADILSQPDDLHGFMLQEHEVVICRDCHSEHMGADASLTFFNGPDFPHELFGFSLEGHEKTNDGKAFECADCHTDEISQFELSTCEMCHLEFEPDYLAAHVEFFGPECLACHDGLDSYSRPFDHSTLGFDLGPAHEDLSCNECHLEARSREDLQAASSVCVDCHREDDIHEGQFGVDCGSCHSPVSWEQFTVDHSLTAFPLIGKHIDVACESCHLEGVFAGTPTTCYDCHWQDDIHNGAFGKDCGACHSEEGLHLVSFDHNTGSASNCSACHLGDRPTSHYPGQCSACHTTDTWQGATFSHTFPINHEGANGDCAKCHPGNANPPYSTYTCYNCHNKNKMRSEHREEGIRNFDNCIRCHWDGREHDD